MGCFFGHCSKGIGVRGSEVCDDLFSSKMVAEFLGACRRKEFDETYTNAG